MKSLHITAIFISIVTILLVASMGYDYHTGHPGLRPDLAALLCLALSWFTGFAVSGLCEILEHERFNKRHGFKN